MKKKRKTTTVGPNSLGLKASQQNYHDSAGKAANFYPEHCVVEVPAPVLYVASQWWTQNSCSCGVDNGQLKKEVIVLLYFLHINMAKEKMYCKLIKKSTVVNI